MRSVEELDSSISIKDTGYFNHSAFPDLILKWPNRPERPLYVRRTYEELEAGHDVARLANSSPVFLAVGRSNLGNRQVTQSRLGVDDVPNRQVLVTNAATIDLFNEDAGVEGGSPLTGAVAANLLPSGKGLLDEERAESVLRPDADILLELGEVLTPAALQSLSTVVGVVSAAKGGELPATLESLEQFSPEEVRELLPWLLRADGITDSAEFWDFIARRVNLKHIEALSEDLADLDLTPLCSRGWDNWQSQRAGLGVRFVDPDRDSPYEQWVMRGKLLTYEVGDASFRFSTYGQAIKERNSVSSATWELVEPTLTDASLLNVVLRGIVRRIRVGAEESGDIREDTRSILQSVKDRYYVDEVTLRYGLASEARSIRLDLGNQIAYNDGNASLRDMVRVLARTGAYRSPVDVPGLGAQEGLAE
ncbi:hypothetical protein [Nocardioides sp. Leaf307]|uniref:hypothetical protein n=1 Tax=Nocardioides sp. Leaf307 TaxID=1736331 RepID=UPI0012EAC9BD|nr:hypothetical protein [Nocardioides sp. Leaf307]